MAPESADDREVLIYLLTYSNKIAYVQLKQFWFTKAVLSKIMNKVTYRLVPISKIMNRVTYRLVPISKIMNRVTYRLVPISKTMNKVTYRLGPISNLSAFFRRKLDCWLLRGFSLNHKIPTSQTGATSRDVYDVIILKNSF